MYNKYRTNAYPVQASFFNQTNFLAEILQIKQALKLKLRVDIWMLGIGRGEHAQVSGTRNLPQIARAVCYSVQVSGTRKKTCAQESLTRSKNLHGLIIMATEHS